MNDYLPEAVRKGLEDARLAMFRRSSRLCIHDGDRIHRILRIWDGGFALGAADAPHLRGFVDLYDGPKHVYQCLVIASREEAGERIFEFKWNTAVADRAPADYARDPETPAALLPYLT
ncbi:MAG: hypothetical protein IT542_00345 [Rubellimicrobium sp.]|nr:hypothetical protein [Rubellimicrobium sp.]